VGAAPEFTRGTENRKLDRGVSTPGNAGNSGTFVRNETRDGVEYARYRADPGTWVSSSMKQLGYDRLYGSDTAFGAYRGLVRYPDGRALGSPDQIRPGQEYLIPLPPERRSSPPAQAPPPAQPRPPQGAAPAPAEGLAQILDFLTGRARPSPNSGDPPANVPTNVVKRIGLHRPAIPSMPLFGNEELSLHRWLYEACRYNDVPVVVMAAILQEENKPGATELTRRLQAGERLIQTELGSLDEAGLDALLGSRKFWRSASRGSTGIANLSRDTLREAAAYVEKTYRRPAVPDSLRSEVGDPRRAGLDMQLDLYYMSALLRRLIDKEVTPGHRGNVTDEQLYRIARDYNGSGPLAEEYGRKVIARLKAVRNGQATYLFLGEPPGEPPLAVQLGSVRGLGF
jgi:hypothetical protein